MEGIDFHMLMLDLHAGVWNEDLINHYVFTQVLSDRERQILLLKIEGLVNGEIALKLKIKPITVKRCIQDIVYKYRNGMGRRIDNHPIIRKADKKHKFVVRRKRK